MSLNYQESTPIVVGSGELYMCKTSQIADLSALTTEEEALLINVGAISEDATVKIEKEFSDVKSCNRGLIKKFCKDTSVTFSAGVLTFIMKNLATLLQGAKFTEDTVNKTKKMIVGATDAAPECYLRFIHTDKDTGKKLIVNIYRAIFASELELTFGEEATVFNYEFTALSTTIDDEAVYMEFIEDDSTAA